ncbi:hypothetical protein GALL_70970 [mine drainage metagenome]|uniref:Uncharacterized protein n=1 Tax=mine drainage metagenome TaxID=410659 RepID=A0A1J5SR10_9ZZZZ
MGASGVVSVTTLANSVSFADVTAGVLAVFGAGIAVVLIIKGAKTVVHALKGL